MSLLLSVSALAALLSGQSPAPATCGDGPAASGPVAQLAWQACVKRVAWLEADRDLGIRLAAIKDPCSPRREKEIKAVVQLAQEYFMVQKEYQRQSYGQSVKSMAGFAALAAGGEKIPEVRLAAAGEKAPKELQEAVAALNDVLGSANRAALEARQETTLLKAPDMGVLHEAARTKMDAWMEASVAAYRARLAAASAGCAAEPAKAAAPRKR